MNAPRFFVFRDDVDDPAGARGVIFSTGAGDDLDAFYLAGGNGLEGVRQAGAENGTGVSVDEKTDIGIAFEFHIPVDIDGHQGNFFQHVQRYTALRGDIAGRIVYQLVEMVLNERFGGCDGDLFKTDRGCFEGKDADGL